MPVEKRFLSIFLPCFSTDLLRRKALRPQDRNLLPSAETPILLETASHQKRIVARCCPKAQSRGVQIGMNTADALLHTPDAAIFPFSLEQEREALQQLALWAYSFSPIVSPDPLPAGSTALGAYRWCGLVLDISGSERLFGSDRQLAQRVHDALRELHIGARVAAAPSIGAAWALSRYHQESVCAASPAEHREMLAALPVPALRISPDVEAALLEVNICRIGELLALPRSAIMTRFSIEPLTRLDQALGREKEVIVPVRPHRPIKVSRSFEYPLLSCEITKQAAREMLAEILTALERLGRKLRCLTLEVRAAEGPATVKNIVFSAPTSNGRHIWKLLDNALEQLTARGGVSACTLACAQDEYFPPESSSHLPEDTAEAPDYQFGELLDILKLQLGEQQVRTLKTAATHIPERSFSYEPLREPVRSSNGEAPLVNADRPSVLFPVPEPIRTMAILPDSPPVRLEWREHLYDIMTGIGPERIAPEWWRGTKQEEARDYFKVQLSTGIWLWVFRTAQEQQWYLHGMWA